MYLSPCEGRLDMQNIESIDWLVKPIEAFLTKEGSESAAGPGCGTEIGLSYWSDFLKYVIESPEIVDVKHLQDIPGKRRPKPRMLKGYSLARYEDKHRKKAHIIDVLAIGVDLDSSALNPDALEDALSHLGVACFWHTTLSHGVKGKPRYRIVFPLEKACPKDELGKWEYTRDKITLKLAKMGCARDESAKDPSRFWYWPACIDIKDYDCGVIEGSLLTLEDMPPPIAPLPVIKASAKSVPAFGRRIMGQAWIDKKVSEYKLLLPGGSRQRWIEGRAVSFAGYYAQGEFQESLSREYICSQFVSAIVSNKESRGWDKEWAFWMRGWDLGEMKPHQNPGFKDNGNKTSLVAPPQKPEVHLEPVDPYMEWETGLLRREHGSVKSMQTNISLIVEHHSDIKGAFIYDEFAERIIVTRDYSASSTHKYPRDIADGDYSEVQAWCERTYKYSPVLAHVVHAVRTAAQKNRVHPLRDYLSNRVRASKDDLLSTWMHRHLGVVDNAYTRAVARKTLIAAVARVFEPGCQVDTMTILEGAQGIGKSSAMRALFGSPYFTDNMAPIGTKDAQIDLSGAWCIELAELNTLRKSEVDLTKAFLSCRIDRFRPPYGKENINRPRQCVFVGTTNKSIYHADETGSRRFWSVACQGTIDIAALGAERDELWAQAVEAYRAREAHWMNTGALLELAKDQQSDRFDADVWQFDIQAHVLNKDEVGIGDILKHLGVEIGRRTQRDQRRVGACLTALGWHGKQVKRSGIKQYVWFAPAARQGPSD